MTDDHRIGPVLPGTGTSSAQEAVDALANPPGRSALSRQAAPHALALARMRERLGDPGNDLSLRSLARGGTGEPAIALLDAWAVVADTVSFYSERIATEGFLRTAVRRGSVRELARTLGYELRPGVAAQVDLAFTVDTAAAPPEPVVVPAGTPVQSVPGPGQLPQTFETGADLETRGAWNALAVVDTVPQELAPGQDTLWVGGTVTLRPGDPVLVETIPRELGGLVGRAADEVVRTVREVVVDPARPGWTTLVLTAPVFGTAPDLTTPDVTALPAVFPPGPVPHRPPIVRPRPLSRVTALRERLRLFGANAPDPNLLASPDRDVPGAHLEPPLTPVPAGPPAGDAAITATRSWVWDGYDVADPLEVDGLHPDLVPDSRLLLEEGSLREPVTVVAVTAGGAPKFALTGPFTRIDLADGATLDGFTRPGAVVHAGSFDLAVSLMPDDRALTGRTVTLASAAPALPAGRRVLLVGADVGGAPAVVAADVAACAADPSAGTLTLTLATDLPGTAGTPVAQQVPLSRHGLVVRANVAPATHGESVHQVLGSGDARTRFLTLPVRRGPLTHVRATTPDGAAAALEVRVDGVQWTPVDSFLDAGPGERVYVVANAEDGTATIGFGDGLHGVRPATGTENLTADYRVGLGEPGAVPAGAVSLLVRRPLGIRDVTNPAATSDWAAAETLEEARANAPLRIRTLDRAVSVADHEDFARAYAGVGKARADLLWDGRVQRVLVTVMGAVLNTVLGTAVTAPSDGLVADLHAALDAARDPGTLLDVLPGDPLTIGVEVDLAVDAAYPRDLVEAGVLAALDTRFGAAAREFAQPLTSAEVLVAVRSVPGVIACTVPRLLTSGPTGGSPSLAVALPGRWDDGVRPAQLLALDLSAVRLGELTP